MKASLILVDDDETLRHVLTRELGEMGFQVRAFASATGVVEAVRAEPPEAVLLDLRLPDIDGLELLRRIREADPDQQVVVLTGHGAVAEAVEAMRLGAHDFLAKPVRLEVLEQALDRAAQKHALLTDNARLRRALESAAGARLLGESAAMQRLRREIESVAPSDSSVLVHGENGTGKELVARAIHAGSRRAAEPFVVVNCGAIPVSLVESELFGHERGAFTGADRRRIGLIEAAHGGTLFLDEIGELPRNVQPAFLRVLQFGEVRPVGSERTRRVDVRTISATNRRLPERIAAGEFREDLYYRVATLVIEVPPLRERRADIPLLLHAFLERKMARIGRTLALDERALARLQAYDWPGNVRELENAAERLAVMTAGERIDVEVVERYVLSPVPARGDLPARSLEELERLAIRASMDRHQGDKRAAAAELGIALKTLYNKLERYGLKGGSG